ncbi:hypothetical protein [Pedobacter punctiformis]|uniref:Uncharacterized protein n=1 Tax=Pedobacter punctiformis TaxID=3004097 RepID=A0ABT4L869_9SPHI|nr:hypothetical protein [Pedobacter sp. HCMS5-2]MCZ4244126.1 hypothetical protein [Pedobacter sp. HCMS5-2]
MKLDFTKIFPALIVLGIFLYFANMVYNFDNLSGRQFALAIIVAGTMVSIFGKVAGAIITALLGIAGFIFVLRDKGDNNKEKTIPTKRL